MVQNHAPQDHALRLAFSEKIPGIFCLNQNSNSNADNIPQNKQGNGNGNGTVGFEITTQLF